MRGWEGTPPLPPQKGSPSKRRRKSFSLSFSSSFPSICLLLSERLDAQEHEADREAHQRDREHHGGDRADLLGHAGDLCDLDGGGRGGLGQGGDWRGDGRALGGGSGAAGRGEGGGAEGGAVIERLVDSLFDDVIEEAFVREHEEGKRRRRERSEREREREESERTRSREKKRSGRRLRRQEKRDICDALRLNCSLFHSTSASRGTVSISRACAPGRSRESGADRDGQGLVLFCVLRLIEKQSQRRKKKTSEDFFSPSVFLRLRSLQLCLSHSRPRCPRPGSKCAREHGA